jgi:calcium/calmodulin-dependent protein kinase I
MNSRFFNSISELNEYKRSLNLTSDSVFTQYLNKIHSNLLQREESNIDKNLTKRKLSNDISNVSTIKKIFSQNKIYQKLNGDNGISLKTFLEYMNIQDFIGERLFKYFNKSKNNILNKTEFTNGISNLYYSDVPELIKLTFFLGDFNEDGKIYKYDMKLLLTYIPSSSDIVQKIKIKQISKIINAFFNEKIQDNKIDDEKEIDFDTYNKYIKEYNDKRNSNNNLDDNDILNEFNNNAPFFYFISILSYLFYNCPFNVQNVNYFAKKTKYILKKSEPKDVNKRNTLLTTIKKGDSAENGKEMIGLMTNVSEKNKFRIEAIPKIGQKNLFKPHRSTSQKIIISDNNITKLKNILNKKRENIKEKEYIYAKEKDEIKYSKIKKEINMFKKKISGKQGCLSPFQRNILNDFTRSPPLNSIVNKHSNEENNNSINKLRYSLKSKLPSITKEKSTPLTVPIHFKKIDKDFKMPSEFVLCDLSESDDSQKNMDVIQEEQKDDIPGIYCFKNNEENNSINQIILNKFYAILSGKEILFFSNENKTELLDLWYVFKSHITIGKEYINNTHYHSVNINYFNTDTINKIYFLKDNECQSFAKKIKKAIHDLSFNDFYELGDELGQGHFAKVCKCKNKNSNKFYAVKIINKEVLKAKDLELIRQEKSFLSLIKHPNIICLKDYFEDKRSIYFVTDYYSGGDLITFIEKNPNITEKTACKIIRKIAEALKYLNIFGIVHRDIKPENILFSEENDFKSLKIIDLGVCKTLTYGQMANEPIGTNGYISPEIYLHNDYSFKTDIWSLGIILYLLITQGLLPFDHENMDNKVIGKKVIYLHQEYPDEYFGKCSKSLINLLDKMLEKNFEKRIDINSLLKDSWFNLIKKQ